MAVRGRRFTLDVGPCHAHAPHCAVPSPCAKDVKTKGAQNTRTGHAEFLCTPHTIVSVWYVDRDHLSPAARLDGDYDRRTRSPDRSRSSPELYGARSSRRNPSPETSRAHRGDLSDRKRDRRGRSPEIDRSRRRESPEQDRSSKARRDPRSERDKPTEIERDRVAILVLESSVEWKALSSCALLVAVVAMIVHIAVTRNAQSEVEDVSGSAADIIQLSVPYLALKEQRNKAQVWYTICAVVLSCASVPPLVKASRDSIINDIAASADVEASTGSPAAKAPHSLTWACATFALAQCFAVHAMLWGSGAPLC